MEDKEVGELWRKIAQFRELTEDHLKATGCTVHAITVNLIRKLVEERRLREYAGEGVARALRDFGIDPKEYNG